MYNDDLGDGNIFLELKKEACESYAFLPAEDC